MSTPTRFFRTTTSLFEAAKASTATKKAAPKPKKKAPKPAGSGTPVKPSGILKPVPVSFALSRFLGGVPEAARTQAVKKVWEHIKLHNLQNPANKREILCDFKLKTIFEGKEKVGFLEITKLLGPHFIKAV